MRFSPLLIGSVLALPRPEQQQSELELARRQQDPLLLTKNLVQSNSEKNGLTRASVGQAASQTSNDNFINECQGSFLTNGLQAKSGSCNGITMGNIPSVQNMVSTIITNPAPGAILAANQPFNVVASVANLQTGSFTNPDTTYYAAPQQLNAQGDIIGHTHVTIQNLGNDMTPNQPLDAQKFAFFKGIDDAAVNGQVTAAVTNGLPAGNYRVCTMSSASNHQAVNMPVAQRGAQDDCVRFQVSGNAAVIANVNANANADANINANAKVNAAPNLASKAVQSVNRQNQQLAQQLSVVNAATSGNKVTGSSSQTGTTALFQRLQSLLGGFKVKRQAPAAVGNAALQLLTSFIGSQMPDIVAGGAARSIAVQGETGGNQATAIRGFKLVSTGAEQAQQPQAQQLVVSAASPSQATGTVQNSAVSAVALNANAAVVASVASTPPNDVQQAIETQQGVPNAVNTDQKAKQGDGKAIKQQKNNNINAGLQQGNVVNTAAQQNAAQQLAAKQNINIGNTNAAQLSTSVNQNAAQQTSDITADQAAQLVSLLTQVLASNNAQNGNGDKNSQRQLSRAQQQQQLPDQQQEQQQNVRLQALAKKTAGNNDQRQRQQQQQQNVQLQELAQNTAGNNNQQQQQGRSNSDVNVNSNAAIQQNGQGFVRNVNAANKVNQQQIVQENQFLVEPSATGLDRNAVAAQQTAQTLVNNGLNVNTAGNVNNAVNANVQGSNNLDNAVTANTRAGNVNKAQTVNANLLAAGNVKNINAKAAGNVVNANVQATGNVNNVANAANVNVQAASNVNNAVNANAQAVDNADAVVTAATLAAVQAKNVNVNSNAVGLQATQNSAINNAISLAQAGAVGGRLTNAQQRQLRAAIDDIGDESRAALNQQQRNQNAAERDLRRIVNKLDKRGVLDSLQTLLGGLTQNVGAGVGALGNVGNVLAVKNAGFANNVVQSLAAGNTGLARNNDNLIQGLLGNNNLANSGINGVQDLAVANAGSTGLNNNIQNLAIQAANAAATATNNGNVNFASNTAQLASNNIGTNSLVAGTPGAVNANANQLVSNGENAPSGAKFRVISAADGANNQVLANNAAAAAAAAAAKVNTNSNVVEPADGNRITGVGLATNDAKLLQTDGLGQMVQNLLQTLTGNA